MKKHWGFLILALVMALGLLTGFIRGSGGGRGH